MGQGGQSKVWKAGLNSTLARAPYNILCSVPLALSQCSKFQKPCSLPPGLQVSTQAVSHQSHILFLHVIPTNYETTMYKKR